jgi:predicted nucleotidyltransferase
MFKEEILHWLKIICHSCGSIIIPPNKSFNNTIRPIKAYLKFIRQQMISKDFSCYKCGTLHPLVTREKTQQLWINKQIRSTITAGKNINPIQRIMNKEMQQSLNMVSD